LPATGIQPRSALGFNIKAVLKLMSRGDLMKEIEELADLLNPSDYENIGKELAEKLKGYIPVIYASERNFGLARNWKIKFNETGKIPAYFNVLPELNHNEMTGFDEARTDAKSKYGPEPTVIEERRKLNSPFHFIFLKDADDHPKIQKRMDITEKLYRDRGLKTEILELLGNGVFYKIFSSLILADWTAYYTAEGYGLEAEKVPIVEEFKKLIN
jgi:glucose/mannose-6-phosphate isomerase